MTDNCIQYAGAYQKNNIEEKDILKAVLEISLILTIQFQKG